MNVMRPNFMMTSLKVPVEIVKGETMQAVGGSNDNGGGSYSIDSLVGSPADPGACKSSASFEWHQEKVAFGLLGTWNVKSMKVRDLDEHKDMTVGVQKNDAGRAELVVKNGSGEAGTELRFTLGNVDEVPADMASLPGSDLTAGYREKGSRQESGFVLDGQTYMLADGKWSKA